MTTPIFCVSICVSAIKAEEAFKKIIVYSHIMKIYHNFSNFISYMAFVNKMFLSSSFDVVTIFIVSIYPSSSNMPS